ncbi:MAG: DUF2461 domain-containing protein [Bacteroidales bacterium]|jgi:uncharacterized protein (TIGR02453 family)|nr:DUF2461 domain-containing protein [Bacteroidales bacterium]
MKNIIDFLINISTNNNRPWFMAHKEEYKQAEEEFHAFTKQLIEGIATFDSSVKGLTVKDCTYRIYRDIRFSPDKTPYKTHTGAYICPGGKKSGNAGYYFHVEPQQNGLLGGNLLTAGLYMPEKNFLQSVREDIMCSGDVFLDTVGKANSFTLDMEGRLKRVPTGFPPDSPYAEYLKLRDICLVKNLSNKDLLSPNLLQNTIEAFSKTVDFNNFLNRAVQFARENS